MAVAQFWTVRRRMLALSHMELARNEFLVVLVVSCLGFLMAVTCLYFIVFKHERFQRFLEWDANFDRRLGMPQWWIDACQRFAKSKANLIFLSIMVGAMFTLMLVGFLGYVLALHRLHQ